MRSVQPSVLKHGLSVRVMEETNLTFVLNTPRINLWPIQSQAPSFHVYRIHRSQSAAHPTYIAYASGKVSFHRLTNNTQALNAGFEINESRQDPTGPGWNTLHIEPIPRNVLNLCSGSLLCSGFAELVRFAYIKSPWNSQQQPWGKTMMQCAWKCQCRAVT
jgi:hypothetical protein